MGLTFVRDNVIGQWGRRVGLTLCKGRRDLPIGYRFYPFRRMQYGKLMEGFQTPKACGEILISHPK